MKIKNHITAVLLLMCILLTPALASSASAHAYDHVYNDVTVITPDSLEDVFGETEVERAAYTYEMVELSNSRAVVALEMELKIGHDYYTTIVSGSVNAYSLPSGDTLYEGPIDGSMTVGEEEYRVTVGFTKVESTDDVMISTTIQGETTMIVISFGDDVIQGEVLDCFKERLDSAQQVNTNNANIINGIFLDEIDNSSGEVASPTVIGDGFAPIFNPGDSGGSYPSYDGGVHQSRRTCYYDDPQYSALQSNVYWKQSSNLLTITVIPRSGKSSEYYNTTSLSALGTVFAVLHSVTGNLKLDADGMNTTTATKGLIKNTLVPSEDEYTINCDIPGYGFLIDILRDILSQRNALTVAVSDLLSELCGKVVAAEDNDAYFNEYTIELSPIDFEKIIELDNTEALAFGYFLEREAPTEYVGNTQYEAKACVTYAVYVELTDGVDGMPDLIWHYYSHETIHQGSVYIQ